MSPPAPPQRYPERSSSLSAIDFPHAAAKKKRFPALALTKSITSSSEEEEMEDKNHFIIDALQRSLSKSEIREPLVQEFTFEAIDRSVSLSLGVDAVDGQVLPAALEIVKIGGREDEKNEVDQRHVLQCEHGTAVNLKEEDTGEDKLIGDDLHYKDKASKKEVTASEACSCSPSPIETVPSAIIRPATPMIPLAFGRKNKDINEPGTESPNNLETPHASPLRINTTEQPVTIPIAENYKENKLSPAQLVPKKKTFVVAISGCTSAGKSVLAKILSEIFDSPSVLPSNGDGGKIKPTITIAQDDFFHPKGLQPFVSFMSTQGDAPFMEKSIHHDEFGMYFITSSGTRPSHPPDTLLECLTGTSHTQRIDSFDSNSSDASCLHEGGHRHLYRVTGPKPDCNQALDFVSLVEAITRIQTTGQLPKYKMRFPCEEDMDQYSNLITKMKEKVAGWVKEQAVLNAEARFGGAVVRGPIESDGKKLVNADAHGTGKATLRPQFVFVEGFLLLADPSEARSSTTRRISNAAAYNIASEKAKIAKYVKQLEELSTELTAKYNIDETIEGERDVIEAQFWATNLKAKEYLQGLFDVKLFLNTSKGESKRRRFQRYIYRDGPEGERLPGQMWKSEGFYEEVVWKAFEENYEWLLEGDGKTNISVQAEKGNESLGLSTKKGVFMEPVQDACVEDVVEWAVEVMLAETGRLEAEARIAGGGCSTDD
ncbi:hypothetical protein ONS95_002067 [Cadophora gregata]|uniref:uncharacterized protein n=1 Tax=Cadophora gregata TaxID=51156 RepID=UPI0026DC056E|nr:uncharacterized protein ONS95_002067 [Cadophora gregata]KAK0111726.1 hypothetical protein ONS95_002067 [Cadophora gregata]